MIDVKKIVVCFLLSTNLNAQVDSLLNALKKLPRKDTTYCRILLEAVEAELDDKKGEKRNNEAIAIINTLKTDPSLSKSRSVSELECDATINKGYYHLNKGNYKEAVESYFGALKIAEKSTLYSAQVTILNSIASIYEDQGEPDKALVYYRKGLKIALEKKIKNKLHYLYNNLGHHYSQTTLNDSVIYYHQKSLAIRQELKDTLNMALSYGNIGHFYFKKLKDYKTALTNLQRGLELQKKFGDQQGVVETLLNISDIYFDTQNVQKAEAYAFKGQQVSQQTNYLFGQIESASRLARIYKKKHDYRRSLQMYELSVILEDSLERGENKNAALKTEFKYESELKEAQIKDLSQQKQIIELESDRKNTLIYSILGGIIALIVIAYFSFARFKAKKENELLQTQLQEAQHRIKIEQKATESELKALKSQMNPHFMFNALNSIQEQFMYGDKAIANEQMGNFTYLTRQILSVSGKKRISLATEIEILTKYLELEKMRFAEGFQYTIHLSERIDEDYHQIPPMLIQPFVENAIKHGLMHKVGEKKLRIAFDLDELEENLLCFVEDNGVGRQKAAEIKSKRWPQHESFSTSATEERLKLLGNAPNGQGWLVYEDLKDEAGKPIGTKLTLKIPMV